MLLNRNGMFAIGLFVLSIIKVQVECGDGGETKTVSDETIIIPPTTSNDVNAVATVYSATNDEEDKSNDTAEVVVESTSTTVEINNATSESLTDEEKNKDVPKSGSSVKIQVSCWDYRKIGMYPPDPDSSSASGTTTTGEEVQSSNETTSSGVSPVVEEIVAEPAEEEEQEQGIFAPTTTDEIGAENDAEGTIEDTSSGSDVGDIVVDQDQGVEVVTVERTVELVNVSHLMNDVLFQNPVIRSKSVPGNCTVVLFHASWCPFSAKAAPHYNALPRAYPPLRVVAIDVQKWKTVNTFFGILGVPTIALFHNGRLIAKFNDSQFNLNKFSEFIEYFTDLKHEERMNVTTKDFEGPVRSVVERDKDLLLLVAWIFLFLTCTHYITKSAIWWRFVEFVRATWREAELQVQPQQHEHVD